MTEEPNSIPIDKQKHFVAGLVLSSLGMLVWPLYSLGFIAGIAKELWDKSRGGPFDWADVGYTWAGASVATILGLCLI